MRRFLFIAALSLAPLAFAVEPSTTREIARYPMQYSGAVDHCLPGCPSFLFSGDYVSTGGTITTNDGTVLTKAGTPTRNSIPTYPAGIAGANGFGHESNTTTEGWYCTDAQCGTHAGIQPVGDFSVQCAFYRKSNAALGYVMTRWTGPTATQRSWTFADSSGNDVFLNVSVNGLDGGASSTYALKTLEGPGWYFVTASFNYDEAGTGDANVSTLYANNLSTASATEDNDGYAFDGDAYFSVLGNAYANSAYTIDFCAIYNSVLTEAQHDRMYAQWQGRISTGGNVISASVTTPPAIPMAYPGSGLEPFVFTLPANTGVVGKISATRGGLPSSEALTNQLFRGSYETCTQNTNTEPDSWTVAETDGAGDGDVLCNATSMAHGLKSLELKATAADSVASIASTCITAGIGYDLAVDFMRKTLSTADGHLLVKINEYDAADCTTAIESDTVIDETLVAGDWGIKHGSRALASWHANTSSYTVSWVTSGIADVLIDAVQMRHTTLQPSDVFCLNDASSAPACSAVTYTTPSPLPANAGRSVKVTVSSPRAASGIAASNIWSTTGGAANEDNLFANTGSVFCRNSDSSNTSRYYRGATALSADAELTYLWGWGSDGAGGCLVSDGSSDYTVEGAGTGLHTAAGATLTIGGASFWVRDLVVYREFLRSMPQ